MGYFANNQNVKYMKKVKQPKKISVVVAVCAFNEEQNIEAFLKSVVNQKQSGFFLEEILVISDGSTDLTAKKARSIKSKLLKVKEFKSRVGKSSRLNKIYSSLQSDILVQSDADIIFAHPYVIRDIIKPLIEDKQVGMCGGNPLPTKTITFTEKAINCSADAYVQFRKKIRKGNNGFSADGRILAYKKSCLKKLLFQSI